MALTCEIQTMLAGNSLMVRLAALAGSLAKRLFDYRVLLLSLGVVPAAFTAAPTLYSQPAFESPVSGDPDDLLMIAGYGFSSSDQVVYAKLTNTKNRLSPPKDIPTEPTPDLGYAPVVSSNNTPHSLTVRLPSILRPREPYALWVHTSLGEWSKPVRINDLRPLWVTPVFVYATAPLAGLPRYLKLVGRNTDPSPGHRTLVKLSGPQSVTLTAEPYDPKLDAFVALFRLPTLLPGRYDVTATRDGSNWIELTGQSVEVRANPKPEPEFAVSDVRFGGCRADDGRDDTRCIVSAIEAARLSGRGTVRFGPGTWNLIEHANGVVSGDGIVVPRGVSLRGTGSATTRLVRDPRWNAGDATAAFTFQGDSAVDGFTFADSQAYMPADKVSSFLHVGENSDRLWSQSHTAPPVVRNLVITHNRFDRTDVAISDGGLGIDSLFITYNEFGTYRNALELGGNVFNMTNRFRIDDSVIAHNTFKPGSFIEVPEHLGPIASEIGASLRLDFSDNVADGASTDYLYSPKDPRGWRAGFFWHMNNDHEMLLVSNNVATCTGDKTGDGEAIALDNSGNTFAFDAMRPAIAADASSVTVAGPLATRQNERDIPLATYYVGHWVQVGDGPGMGQARKITAYSIDTATGNVTFNVTPRWDVVPASGTTRVSVGREFWQTLILGNRVDQRVPLCQKSNRSRAVGGAIALWAQLADSVVAGNEQYDTDGVTIHENYNSLVPKCDHCGAETFFQSFLEIRGNLIDGKYDTATDCSASGITGGVSAAPAGTQAPPTLGYGIQISHNRIRRADNTAGGALTVGQGWYDGPPPHRWPLMENLIVQHNLIEGRGGPIVGRDCDKSQPRRGISFPGSPLTWRTVLYGNSCSAMKQALGPGGVDTQRVCPSSAEHSCECMPAGAYQ